MPNIAVPAPDMAFWDLKFHQVAIYTSDIEEAVNFWIDAGYNGWSSDTATLVGSEYGNRSQKEATMLFNYDIMPLELEYVCYSTGYRHSRDDRDGHPPFLSHMSTYVEDIDAEVDRVYIEFGQTPYHKFVTQDHTNPAVVGKKRFMEAIYDTRRYLGFDIKMIQRVGWDFTPQEVDQWAAVK